MNPVSLLLDMLNGFLGNLIDSLIDFYISVYQALMHSGQGLLNNPLVTSTVNYVQILSGYILVLKLIFEAYQIYMLRQAGDPDSDPIDLLIRGAQAIAVITLLPWIVRELYSFGMKVSADVAGLHSGGTGSIIASALNNYKGIVEQLIGIGLLPANILVILLIFLIGMIMLFVLNIQLAIRNAELVLMTVMGAIMALNITTNNRSIWNQWFRQVLGICLTNALQTFMLLFSLRLVGNMGLTAFSTLIEFIGWMYVTVKVPTFIRQFTNIPSTGLGSAVKQFAMLRLIRK